MQLQIPEDIYEQMVVQARAGAPLEVCGILAGSDGAAGVVAKLYEMTNTDQSREHFMMKPEEQFAVVRDIRSLGLEMLAVYHSHPDTPARPSGEDIRLALTTGVTYVIVSLQDKARPIVKGFDMDNGSVREVAVKIISS